MPWVTDQNGFTYWEDDTTGQIITPLSSEPSPEPTQIADKPDFSNLPTEADREQSLRDALAASDANRDQLASEGQDTTQFDQSVQDISAKVAVIDAYKEADQPLPEDAKAVTVGALAGFTDLAKGELNLTAAVKAGVPDTELRKLGISQTEIVNVRRALRKAKQGEDVAAKIVEMQRGDIQAFAPLTGKAAFDELVREGKIKEGSRFSHVDEKGDLVYFPPFAGLEDSLAEFNKLDKKGKQLYVKATFQPTVTSTDTTTRQDFTLLKGQIRDFDSLPIEQQERVVMQFQRDRALQQMTKDMHAGLIPVVGTVYTWNRMSTPWKVVSIVSDVMFFLPTGKLASGIRTIAKGGKTSTVIEDTIMAGAKQTHAQLQLLKPELAKPFSDLTKTQVKFGKNYADVVDLTKTLKSTQGEVKPEIARSLELAQARLKGNEAAFLKQAREYADAAKVLGEDDIIRSEINNLPQQLRRSTTEFIDRLVNPRTVKQVREDLKFAQEALRAAQAKAPMKPGLWVEPWQKVNNLQRELYISEAGGIDKLHMQLVEFREQIPRLERAVREAQATNSPALPVYEEALVYARTKARDIPKYLQDALYSMEVEWGEDTTKIIRSTLGIPVATKIVKGKKVIDLDLSTITDKELQKLLKARPDLKKLVWREQQELKQLPPGTPAPVFKRKIDLDLSGVLDINKEVTGNEAELARMRQQLNITRSQKTREEIRKAIKQTEKQIKEKKLATKTKTETTTVQESVAEPGKNLPAKKETTLPAKQGKVEMPKPAPKTAKDDLLVFGPRKSARGLPVEKRIPSEVFGRMTIEQIARRYGLSEESIVSAIVSSDTGLRNLLSEQIYTNLRNAEQVRAAVAPYAIPETRVRVQVEPETKTKTIPLPEVRTVPLPKPEEEVKTTTPTPTKIITVTTPTPRVALPPLDLGTDAEKRKRVLQAKGAIAWRQGEVSNKSGGRDDVWHVIVDPYTERADHFTVIGRRPANATIVRGPGSAYKTAQLLYGKELSREVTHDIGLFDARMEPISGGQGVRLSFEYAPGISGTASESVSKSGKVFPLERKK